MRRFDRVVVLLIFLTHAAVAVHHKLCCGLEIGTTPRVRAWDWWWQTIPVDLLTTDLVRSIFYLHSQPPLFNLYGSVFFNLFPASALEVMHWVNICIGALIPAMVYVIVLLRTGTRPLALALGLLTALDAGLFLFEAYVLYDLLTLFWITSATLALTLYYRRARAWHAVVFFTLVSLLILTRSAYHLLVYAAGLVLVLCASNIKARRMLLLGLLVALLPLGWYLKNFTLYGFFGSSSWQGFSLWKVASYPYTPTELKALADRGEIDPMTADLEILRPPSSYAPYGFTLKSDIPLLNRDDRHNVNLIAVARVYQENALCLIRRDPARYLRSMLASYRIFNIPAARFKHHQANIARMSLHCSITADLVQGGLIARLSGLPIDSIYCLLVPLCLIVFSARLLGNLSVGLDRNHLMRVLRGNAFEMWIVFIIAYTTTVSLCFESGENNREKFYVESLILIYVAIEGQRLYRFLSTSFQQLVQSRGTAIPHFRKSHQ